MGKIITQKEHFLKFFREKEVAKEAEICYNLTIISAVVAQLGRGKQFCFDGHFSKPPQYTEASIKNAQGFACRKAKRASVYGGYGVTATQWLVDVFSEIRQLP